MIFKVYFMQYRVKSQLYFLQNFVKTSLTDVAFLPFFVLGRFFLVGTDG